MSSPQVGALPAFRPYVQRPQISTIVDIMFHEVIPGHVRAYEARRLAPQASIGEENIGFGSHRAPRTRGPTSSVASTARYRSSSSSTRAAWPKRPLRRLGAAPAGREAPARAVRRSALRRSRSDGGGRGRTAEEATQLRSMPLRAGSHSLLPLPGQPQLSVEGVGEQSPTAGRWWRMERHLLLPFRRRSRQWPSRRGPGPSRSRDGCPGRESRARAQKAQCCGLGPKRQPPTEEGSVLSRVRNVAWFSTQMTEPASLRV